MKTLRLASKTHFHVVPSTKSLDGSTCVQLYGIIRRPSARWLVIAPDGCLYTDTDEKGKIALMPDVATVYAFPVRRSFSLCSRICETGAFDKGRRTERKRKSGSRRERLQEDAVASRRLALTMRCSMDRHGQGRAMSSSHVPFLRAPSTDTWMPTLRTPVRSPARDVTWSAGTACAVRRCDQMTASSPAVRKSPLIVVAAPSSCRGNVSSPPGHPCFPKRLPLPFIQTEGSPFRSSAPTDRHVSFPTNHDLPFFRHTVSH